MGINYAAGRFLNHCVSRLLTFRSLPLFRTFALGWRYEYDMARFAGTRDLSMFFDVGANVGQTSRELLHFYPRATIHAFEPIHATYEQLLRNLVDSKNVQAHHLALGERPGAVEVELQNDPFLNSLKFHSVPGPTGSGQRERLTVSTVDEFAAAHQITQIDLLKVDAQGSDLDVLRGASRMLRGRRIRYVLCEVSFEVNDPINQPFTPVHEYLCSHDLSLCGLYGPVRNGPRGAFVGFRDALYANPELLGQA